MVSGIPSADPRAEKRSFLDFLDVARSGPEFAQAVLDALTASVAVLDQDGTIIAVNARWRAFADENGAVHPQAFVGENYLTACGGVPASSADGTTVANRIHDVLAGTANEFRFEYPCHSPDEERWFELRATSFSYDQQRFAMTAHENVTDRKRLDEARLLLVRELNHRVNNLFAVATSMITLTAKRVDTARQLADAVCSRLAALAKAHQLLTPAVDLGADGDPAQPLDELLRTLTGAHLTNNPDRIRVAGPDLSVGRQASIGLALLIHELATNATKYGALSDDRGALSIHWQVIENQFVLIWTEEHGPPLAGPPARAGFGSELARRAVVDHLGGHVERDWLRDGLVVKVTLPVGNLGR